MVIITQGDQPVVVAYGRSNYICLFHCSIEFRILISSWIACIFISIFNHIFGLKKTHKNSWVFVITWISFFIIPKNSLNFVDYSLILIDLFILTMFLWSRPFQWQINLSLWPLDDLNPDSFMFKKAIITQQQNGVHNFLVELRKRNIMVIVIVQIYLCFET